MFAGLFVEELETVIVKELYEMNEESSWLRHFESLETVVCRNPGD